MKTRRFRNPWIDLRIAAPASRHAACDVLIKRRDLSHFDTGRRGMQAISPLAASMAVRSRSTREPAGSAETAVPSPCRAVVPIRPIAAGAAALAARRYPLGCFLAHLIAVRQGAPQTGRRGRATPGEASAAYAATQGMAAHGPQRYRKTA
jgi:hypothetical protein